MMTNAERREVKSERRWNYLAVKKLLIFLKGITSKHQGDFYCFSCLDFFRTKNKLDSEVCKNKDFCNVIMPFKDTKILQFNQYQKSDKALLIILKFHIQQN